MNGEVQEIESTLKQRMNVAMIAALRVGQVLAEQIQQRSAKAKSERAAEARRQLAEYNHAFERASGELSQIPKSQWWENATPDDIGHALALADGWKDHIPEAAEVRETIFTQLEERYGVLVVNAESAPELIAAQLRAWEEDRVENAEKNDGDLSDLGAAEVTASGRAEAVVLEQRRQVRFEAIPGTEIPDTVPEGLADGLTGQAQDPVEAAAPIAEAAEASAPESARSGGGTITGSRKGPGRTPTGAVRTENPVTFVPIPGTDQASTATKGDVLQYIRSLPERPSPADNAVLVEWAGKDIQVDAAIWRQNPAALIEGINAAANGDAARAAAEEERTRAAQELGIGLHESAEADEYARAARHERANIEAGTEQGSEARAERAEAAGDAADTQADYAFDSAERRTATAEHLEQAGVSEGAVEARMIADKSQGRPAREAVGVKRAAKARVARGKTGRGREAEISK